VPAPRPGRPTASAWAASGLDLTAGVAGSPSCGESVEEVVTAGMSALADAGARRPSAVTRGATSRLEASRPYRPIPGFL